MTKRDELIALDPAGLEAAVRECARITAPEISDVEYERIKADNSPRYQNTRAEMERTLRAYLNAARSDAPGGVEAPAAGDGEPAFPTWDAEDEAYELGKRDGYESAIQDLDIATGGDGEFKGSTIPGGTVDVPAMKARIVGRANTTPSAPSVAVKAKALTWRDHRPDSFPEPAWSAETPFGFYRIEEVSASDSPAYVVRLHAHHFVADKDSLDEAKAAAQADYEARIKSALVEVPADAGMREAFVRVLASLAAAISILERTPKAKRAVASDKMFDQMLDDYRKALEAGRSALTAPDATTKSDGGAKAGSSPILASKEEQRPDTHGMMPVGDNAANVGCTGVGPSDPSSTRSEVTALADIAAERERQREVEGWTPAHDDTHDRGEMLTAAWCYMQRHADADMWGGNAADEINTLPPPARWPWSREWWKPTNRRRDLVKAGALIVAEIERLDRLDQFEIRRK